PIRWFTKRNTLSGARAILVGDAAGGGSLFCEGIGQALGYGGLGARALIDAFTRPGFSFLPFRGQGFRSLPCRSLRYRHALARILYRLRSRPLLRFIWCFSPILEWTLRRLAFGWAQRAELDAGRPQLAGHVEALPRAEPRHPE